MVAETMSSRPREATATTFPNRKPPASSLLWRRSALENEPSERTLVAQGHEVALEAGFCGDRRCCSLLELDRETLIIKQHHARALEGRAVGDDQRFVDLVLRTEQADRATSVLQD